MIDIILGNKVLVRILRLLYQSPNRYFSFLDVERFVGAGREGTRLALRKLVYFGLVYVEKKGGKRYKLRQDNHLVKLLGGVFELEKKFFQGIDQRKMSVIANVENDCLKDIPGLKEIWLFGSVAKGKAREKSDIDLFVLVEKNTPLLKVKLEQIKEKYEKKYDLQMLVMDGPELKKRKNDLLLREIKSTGINLAMI